MNDPYSVVEDLTPEPASRAGAGRWRDVGIGLLLIALVAGFAGWNWWHTESQSSEYRAGQAAMSAHEWETAIGHFRNASGYLDSDDLLDLAGKEQARTEDVYEKGMAFATAKNWIAAMQTLGDLKKEQAGYKETNKTWDEAREQVYKQALQGTVVSRSRGNGSNLSVVPAGSKFGDFGGWYPLLNSDGYSRVLGGCTDGKILYDIAGEGWAPKQVISSDPNGPPTAKEQLQGRVLVVGNLLTYTNPDFLKLSVDPSAYDRFLCGRTGMWLYDYGPAGAPDHFPATNDTPVRNAEAGYKLTYVSFDGTISQTLTYSDTTITHEVPVAVDYASDRIVVAKWSGEDPNTGFVTQDTAVDLYLVTLDGVSKPQLIFQTKWNGVITKSGGIQSVQISPDGRYVLVNEFVPLTVAGKSYETDVRFLVDTHNPDADKYPQIAAADFGVYPANWITSAFVEHGTFAGKVITAKFLGDKFKVELTDPAKPAAPIASVQVDTFTTGEGRVSPTFWMVAREDFDGIALVGRQAIRNGATLVAWALVTVTISSDGKVTTSRTITADGWLRLYPFALAANRLIYTSDIDALNGDWAVWSTPVEEPVYNGANATQVYKLKYGTSQTRQPYDKVTFGPDLFAYVENNSLHARSYDSLYDVTLEDGIGALWGAWRYAQYVDEMR